MTNWNCFRETLQECADNDPTAFQEYCPCCCANDAVIYICNSNHITDDDFDIKLNGTSIGSIYLTTDNTSCGSRADERCLEWDYYPWPDYTYTPCPYPPTEVTDSPGGWWSSDPAILPSTLGNSSSPCYPDNNPTNPGWTCCTTGLTLFTLDVSLIVSGENIIEMININQNYHGNYGSIGVFRTNSSGYICEHIIDQFYSMWDGGDADFYFDWNGPAPTLRLGIIKRESGLYVDRDYYKAVLKNRKHNQKIKAKRELLLKSLETSPPAEEELKKAKDKNLLDGENAKLLKSEHKLKSRWKNINYTKSAIEAAIEAKTVEDTDCKCKRRKIPVRKNIKLN